MKSEVTTSPLKFVLMMFCLSDSFVQGKFKTQGILLFEDNYFINLRCHCTNRCYTNGRFISLHGQVLGHNPAFRAIMMGYKLMSLFRQVVLQSKSQATLSTLRLKCFALGSWIIKHAGKTILNISAIGEKRICLD